MLVELNYVFFSFLLVVYIAWRYSKRRERGLLYLTLSFIFLASSTTLQMLNSLIWVYGTQPSVTMLRLLELNSLALFACFTISAIIALGKILETSNLD